MNDDYRYEVTAEVQFGAISVMGTVTNLSPADWERGSGVGGLNLLARFRHRRLDEVVRAGVALLPAVIPHHEAIPFGITLDLATLEPGSYQLDVEFYRDQQFWFTEKGASGFTATVLIPHDGRVSAEQHWGAEPHHPYRGLPGTSFWNTGVAGLAPADVSPITDVPFRISRTDRVATGGSCFAQRLALHLQQTAFNFFGTEPPIEAGGPRFSANYGNVYTALQLHQLLLRAFGLLRPRDVAWKRADGRFIDPFRPQLFDEGFPDVASVRVARDEHLRAVRRLFTECDVFIFTLGLTEAWMNSEDGVVLPLPPGAVCMQAGAGPYDFINFPVAAVMAQLEAFIRDARQINAGIRLVFTVSPVPIIATYERRHVLASNTYSKSVLRVAASEIADKHENVAYFPSYELFAIPGAPSAFAEDGRTVLPARIERVMQLFSDHYLQTDERRSEAARPRRQRRAAAPQKTTSAAAVADNAALAKIICDEDLLGNG